MSLNNTDIEIYNLIKNEELRLSETLQMIPSENYTSKEVREAEGSVFVNKYSEGLPKKRYYQGNTYVDELELLTQKRAKEIFGVDHVNVQPYSGSNANNAVYFGLLEPGEAVMGMSLVSGGHLSHGHTVNFSGKYFKSIQYEVEKDGTIDYDKLRRLAEQYKPKIIVCGSTAFPCIIDFEKFAEVADKVGAYLMADISHIAGLVAGGAHPSPTPWAHIITTTTHKTLRGPRGALIMVTKKGLVKNPEIGHILDKAVFPGLQGGPHNHTIAGIAVALGEAQKDSFKEYATQVVKNAKTLAECLRQKGYELVSGSTENHLILIDLSNKGIDGWFAAWALEAAGIIVNRNTVPGETKSAYYPSGIRLGTPAITTRSMKEKEMLLVADYIDDTISLCVNAIPRDLSSLDKDSANAVRKHFKETIIKDTNVLEIRKKVKELCVQFPLD